MRRNEEGGDEEEGDGEAALLPAGRPELREQVRLLVRLLLLLLVRLLLLVWLLDAWAGGAQVRAGRRRHLHHCVHRRRRPSQPAACNAVMHNIMGRAVATSACSVRWEETRQEIIVTI